MTAQRFLRSGAIALVLVILAACGGAPAGSQGGGSEAPGNESDGANPPTSTGAAPSTAPAASDGGTGRRGRLRGAAERVLGRGEHADADLGGHRLLRPRRRGVAGPGVAGPHRRGGVPRRRRASPGRPRRRQQRHRPRALERALGRGARARSAARPGCGIGHAVRRRHRRADARRGAASSSSGPGRSSTSRSITCATTLPTTWPRPESRRSSSSSCRRARPRSSRNTSPTYSTFEYESTESIDALRSFYEDAFADAGWEVFWTDTYRESGTYWDINLPDGRRLTVSVNPAESGSGTTAEIDFYGE